MRDNRKINQNDDATIGSFQIPKNSKELYQRIIKMLEKIDSLKDDESKIKNNLKALHIEYAQLNKEVRCQIISANSREDSKEVIETLYNKLKKISRNNRESFHLLNQVKEEIKIQDLETENISQEFELLKNNQVEYDSDYQSKYQSYILYSC